MAELRAERPTIRSRLSDLVAAAVRPIAIDERHAQRVGNRAGQALDWVPGLGATMGAQEGVQQAQRGYRSGNLSDLVFGGAGMALSVLPGGRKAKEGLETVFRGVSSVSPKHGNYYTGNREWARQFTQSGQDSEILQRQIAKNDIYETARLPSAVREQEVDAAIAEARRQGKKAIRVDEGAGEPPSLFVFDRSALR